jgi:uncharacterized membrane protein
MVSTERTATVMAAVLTGTGILHFAVPKPFDAIVPPEIPLSPRQATYASGVAELTCAALLAAPRTRRLGGLAAAALFTAVFPANLHMVRLWADKPLPYRVVAYGRVPLQLPLIWAAVRVARGDG